MARMDPWIAEFKEIIDLSVSLFTGNLESGSRIAVVLLDNCVEFMFKAYLRVKKRVVGTGKKYAIKPNEWESKVSRQFNKLADAMRAHSKLSHDLIDEAEHYHTIRNDLYHTGTPVKTGDAVFKEQLKVVLKILQSLYSTKHSPKSVKLNIADASQPSPEDRLKSTVKTMPGNPQALNLNLPRKISFAQIIRIILYGQQKIVGAYGSVKRIAEILALNMQPSDEKKICATLAELKQRNQVTEDEGVFALTDFGLKALTDAI